MHGPINVKSPNNISEWQMGFNSAFKVLSALSEDIFIRYGSLLTLLSGFDSTDFRTRRVLRLE